MALKIFPLVAVKCKNGVVKIAESDYDPKIHQLADEKAKPTAEPKPETDDTKPETEGGVNFSKMTKDELVAFANTNTIDLGQAKSKTEILQALEAWKEANNV